MMKPTPSETLLSADLSMAQVTLTVDDLSGMAAYYREALGLVELHAHEGTVVLGRSGVPIVELVHTPGLPVPARSEAGLFHTALLFDSRAGLAAALHRAVVHPRSRYVGSADHLVSEAFYFTDPEGNGIELYHDRPRAEWPRVGGRIQMDNLPLDPRAFLVEHGGEAGAPTAEDDPAHVGHVHLQVGDISTAHEFYVDTLGFEVVVAWDSAIFVSAGGYHHHMAMNTWNSRGAGPRAASLGLGEVAITLPGREHLDAARARLEARGLQVADDGQEIRVADPWGSRVALRLA